MLENIIFSGNIILNFSPNIFILEVKVLGGLFFAEEQILIFVKDGKFHSVFECK